MSDIVTGMRRQALPYKVLAGVEPCAGGWLVAPGNLQGIQLAPQPPFVVRTLADVLDYRPSFTVVAIHAPMGAADDPSQRRRCDVEARRLLGPRAAAAVPAPPRKLLDAESLDEAQAIDSSCDIVRWRMLPKARESVQEVQSWRQRTAWEVNPELAFRQMNDGVPLSSSRTSIQGLAERTELLERKLPGAMWILQGRSKSIRERKLIDALADLWTSRRIMAHAITRLGDPPEWDTEGVRMDIVC